MTDGPEPQISRLSPQEVKNRLDRGESVFFCDVRRHPDGKKIKGALYFDPEAILNADRIQLPGIKDKDQLIITYCT